MLSPTEVQAASTKKEKENYAFRSFLKNHGDPELMDQQFLQLHQELFAGYDCSACRNCCKEYQIDFDQAQVEETSTFLAMTPQKFTDQYLTLNMFETGWETKKTPCPFLFADGHCQIEAIKPSGCQGYPYTDRPGRIESLLGIIESASVCPVVFEMLERLKQIYRFKWRRL